MMNVWLLCEQIDMPQSIVLQLKQRMDAVGRHREHLLALSAPNRAEAAHTALADILGEDDMAILACHLEAAAHTFDCLLSIGVPEKILLDTYKCFPRFLAETKHMTGEEKFDRGFWTWRQASGLLLRIGVLEYEMLPERKEISLHIPSDSRFTPEQVDASLKEAKAFFAVFFPEYKDAPYVCHSWLLSPELGKLLPEDSNIAAFQRRFAITHVEPDSREFIGWLFRCQEDTPAKSLPEATSLQKKVKQLLLEGGNIGEARGNLI